MPLARIQSDILRLLAAHRDPESYVAGSTLLNVNAPRYSGDIDVFHDRESPPRPVSPSKSCARRLIRSASRSTSGVGSSNGSSPGSGETGACSAMSRPDRLSRRLPLAAATIVLLRRLARS